MIKLEILKRLSIDLSGKQNAPVVYAVQGEKNSRKIKFLIFQNGVSLAVDTVDQVLVSYQKPDGHGGVYDTLEGGTLAYEFDASVHNSVTITLAEQVLTTPGNVLLIVSFIAENSVMSTFHVIVNVEENPGIGVSESVDYFSLSVAIDVAKKVVGENFDPAKLISKEYVDQKVDSVRSDVKEDIDAISESAKTFYVNISKNEEGLFFADKSVAVVFSAYQSGRNVKAKIDIDGEIVAVPLIGIIEEDTVYYVGYAVYGKYVSISHTDVNVFVQTNEIPDDVPQNAVLYTPQTLTPEQQAQALANLGLDELLTVGGAWEKVADITLNERVLTVNIPVDGSQYNALYLRGSIAAWVVADEAPYSGSSMLSGARCCGIKSIPYSIHGNFTGFDVLMLNVGDNFYLPFAIGANGNSGVNGSVLTYNPINGRRQIVSSISASAWLSDIYRFMEGSTFELWGVKK